MKKHYTPEVSFEMDLELDKLALDDLDSLSATPLCVTHINLLDGTVEGVVCEKDRAMGVQYHPESAPGPQDSAYLFDDFIRLMKEGN